MVISSSCSFCASCVWTSLISCFNVELCFNSRSSCSCLSTQIWRANCCHTKKAVHIVWSHWYQPYLRVCVCEHACVCLQAQKTSGRLSKLWLTLGSWGFENLHFPLKITIFIIYHIYHIHLYNINTKNNKTKNNYWVMYLIIIISYARKGFFPLKQTWKNTASCI